MFTRTKKNVHEINFFPISKTYSCTLKNVHDFGKILMKLKDVRVKEKGEKKHNN